MSKSSVLFILGLSLLLSAAALSYLVSGAATSFKGQDEVISYFSENELISGLAAAAIGSLLTALIVFLIEDNRDKRQAAVNLLEEFSSFDFLETRNRAGLVFKEHLFQPLKGLDDLYFVLQNENWRYISHMEHFFKKVDRLISLGEVDKKYILSFLEFEFPHWYNSYFFPAAVADMARSYQDEANEKGVFFDKLLPLDRAGEKEMEVNGKKVAIPLKKVDYISVFGASRRAESKAEQTKEVIEFLSHLEELKSLGIISADDFRQSGMWYKFDAKSKPNYLKIYEGNGLPFPALRKILRKI